MRGVPRLKFQVQAQSPGTRARAGTFETLHGSVQTPVFMPVGTQATVKGQTVESLRGAGSRVLLANTYHLMLRPGVEVFRHFGGIHRFMNWDGPVLTDSGGFQIFSLPNARQMNEEGARFQSYLDGSLHLLSPEKSIEVQKAIGSDIMMVLDQCIPSTAEYTVAHSAMELTHRWALRSLNARGESPQALFGIVQGACFPDLRRQSAQTLTQMPFDGFAIGGLAVGETKAQREEFTELTAELLPQDLPRYLMGVGTPLDILEAVHRGVDMFDCIIPSQIAQRGGAFTSHGRLQLRRTLYKFAEAPLDADCVCPTCKNYSRAYLHHLHKAGEVIGWKLITTHNLYFYHRLMREIREAIFAGTFEHFYRAKQVQLALSDNECEGPSKPSKVRKRLCATRGDYELVHSDQGYSSIRQISSGETMHSVSDPTEEANRLYIEQSDLEGRLRSRQVQALVIWDVGLGAATNAMAALACYEKTRKAMEPELPAAVHMVSFEKDLDPLRLGLKHAASLVHLRHQAPHVLLKERRWTSADGGFVWELMEGDFLSLFPKAPAPDLIFYDPFSFKTDGALWTPNVFAAIRAHCGDRAAELFTYSASTAVRAALLSAGFYVGSGVGTGPKQETTRAFTQIAAGLLGGTWLEKWERSDARFPVAVTDDQRPDFERVIRQHPQFQPSIL